MARRKTKRSEQLVRMLPMVLAVCATALATQTALCDETAATEQLREELQQLQRTIAEQQATIGQQKIRLQELERSLSERIEAIEQESLSAVAKQADRKWPAWVENTTWKGDLRLRYEYYDSERESGDDNDRHRERVRFRYGFTYEFDDKTEIGARLVTGNGDPTSTNQSLDNTFGGKNIFLDRIYVKYSPCDWLDLYGGKFANPFVRTDVIWDSDVQPEGFAQRAGVRVCHDVSVFANLGQLVLEEVSDDNDPYALVGQIGCDVTLPADTKFTLAAAYYDFSHVNETALTYRDTGNTRVDRDGDGAAETLLHDYDLLDLYGSLRLAVGSVPVNLYADYINNLAIGDDDSGFRAGVQLGESKKKGDVLVEYAYRLLERDATLDALTDGTFHNGGTNCKGHILAGNYMIGDKWSFTLTVFLAQEEGGSRYDHNTVLADMVWRF